MGKKFILELLSALVIFLTACENSNNEAKLTRPYAMIK